jgi:putative peptidoglycan lipid II flippase
VERAEKPISSPDAIGVGPPSSSSQRTRAQVAARLESVLGAALIVMSGFVASKLLGLIRNIVISHQYGATREYEQFIAAISVPDTAFQVLAGGTVSAAFIPVFTSFLAQRQERNAWRLMSGLMNLALVGIGVIALALAIAAPALTGLLVPGWTPAEQQEVARLARIMMISPVIFAVSALVTSVLNGAKRFALATAAPLMYNLSLIGGAIFLRAWGAEGLAYAAVVGALLHLAVQLPGLARIGAHYSLGFALDLAGTREVGRLMIPRVLSLGVSQLNLLVNVALASFLIQGSVAYLSYAWLLLMVPLGVVGMGMATAVFPTLAEQSAQDQPDEQRQTFLFALRLILYLTVPAAVGLAVLGYPIVALLLQRGAFDPSATWATSFALAWYAVGLPGHATIEIVDRVFYAQHDTATPLRIAALGAAINIVFSVILMRTELSFGGLALANSIAALTEATLLTLVLQRRLGWIRARELVPFAWRVALAAAAMGGVALLLYAAVSARVDIVHWTGQATVLFSVAVTAGIVYGALSLALGVNDARRVASLIRRRS